MLCAFSRSAEQQLEVLRAAEGDFLFDGVFAGKCVGTADDECAVAFVDFIDGGGEPVFPVNGFEQADLAAV